MRYIIGNHMDNYSRKRSQNMLYNIARARLPYHKVTKINEDTDESQLQYAANMSYEHYLKRDLSKAYDYAELAAQIEYRLYNTYNWICVASGLWSVLRNGYEDDFLPQ